MSKLTSDEEHRILAAIYDVSEEYAAENFSLHEGVESKMAKWLADHGSVLIEFQRHPERDDPSLLGYRLIGEGPADPGKPTKPILALTLKGLLAGLVLQALEESGYNPAP